MIHINQLKQSIDSVEEISKKITSLRSDISKLNSEMLKHQTVILIALKSDTAKFPIRIVIEDVLYTFEYDGSFDKHKIDKIL